MLPRQSRPSKSRTLFATAFMKRTCLARARARVEVFLLLRCLVMVMVVASLSGSTGGICRVLGRVFGTTTKGRCGEAESGDHGLSD